MRCGGLLLDVRGRVVSFNVIALSCLGDGLALGGERLRAGDHDTDQRLRSMIGSALQDVDHQETTLSVVIQRRSRLPLVVRFVRLDEDPERTPGTAMLLVLLLDPELRQNPPPEILAQAFELTGAESEVAIGILSGKTLAEIATARGVKVGTVRAHSKAVFSKTHTRGQADLTGVLTRLSFVVPQLETATTKSSSGNIRMVRPKGGPQLLSDGAGSDDATN